MRFQNKTRASLGHNNDDELKVKKKNSLLLLITNTKHFPVDSCLWGLHAACCTTAALSAGPVSRIVALIGRLDGKHGKMDPG